MGGCCGQSSKLSLDDQLEIQKETKLSLNEIKHMHNIFQFEYHKGNVSKKQFTRILSDLYADKDTDDFAMAMFNLFDLDGDGQLNFKEYIIGLHRINTGTVEEKLRWLFRLYDLDNSGYVTKEELKHFFEIMNKIASQDDDFALSQAEYMLHRMEISVDGEVALEDLMESAREYRSIRSVHSIPRSSVNSSRKSVDVPLTETQP